MKGIFGVMKSTHGEFELVDLDLDVLDLEGVILASARGDVDSSRDSFAGDDDVGDSAVADLRESFLLVDVEGDVSKIGLDAERKASQKRTKGKSRISLTQKTRE